MNTWLPKVAVITMLCCAAAVAWALVAMVRSLAGQQCVPSRTLTIVVPTPPARPYVVVKP